MSSPSLLNRWPCYPDIPIILDTQDEHRTPLIDGTSEKTLHVPHVTPDGRPLQFVRVVSSIESGNPCFRVSIPETTYPPFRNQLRRPTLGPFLTTENLEASSVFETSPRQSYWGRQPYIQNKTQQERGAAIVKCSLAGSQIPFQSSSSQKKTIQIDPESGCQTAFGLGIVNDPLNTAPLDINSASHQRNNSAPNIAQRIEKRIWQYNFSANVVERWLVEIVSWIISAICMAAIIGVLIFLKDKKLKTGPLGLTLNTYIAVLSKIASAALLLPTSEALGQLKWSWFQGGSKKMWDFEIFDNASRGPWGSILLLIRTKGRTLAALGAAITLLTLALDPFFQQVVDYPDRWVRQGNSSLPMVTRYEPQPVLIFRDGVKIAQQDKDLQNAAEKFFYDNGTQPMPFGNGTRADIPLSCPTSNCTWPSYETLAVCSSCVDVSKYLEFTCLTAKLDWVANSTGGATNWPNGTMCGYFLNATSDNPVLMSGYQIDLEGSSEGEILLMRALPLVVNPTKERLYGGSIHFKELRNPIIDAIIVSAANGPSVYRNETPVAHECVLSWCVQTIQSSYFWANYQEEVVKSFKNITAGPYPWDVHRVEGPINGTDVHYLQDINISPSESGNRTYDFGVSNTTAMAIINIFDDIFPSFTTIISSTAEEMLRFQVNKKGPPMLRSLETNPWLPPNNISHHMERLATSLTNVMRSSASNETVLGVAFNKENFVAVRWTWLTFPLSVLFLSLIFLISTVVKSSKEKELVGVWKTSAIATLLYGFPDDMQSKIKSSTSAGTPRAKAKELRVKLLPKGWRVSGNLFSPMTPKVMEDQPPPGWI